MNKKEIWKPYPEFPNYYAVSDLGNVKRTAKHKNQIAEWDAPDNPLIPRNNGHGYLYLMLSINNQQFHRYIHRMVALTFCENDNPTNKTEVNHIDGNKQNNSAKNLEWVTHSENGKHAYANGLRSVKGCYGLKRKVCQLHHKTLEILNIYESIEQAENSLSGGKPNISGACSCLEFPTAYKKPINTVKGYKWCYWQEGMEIGDYVNLESLKFPEYEVIQYSKEGEEINRYKNIILAAESVNGQVGYIHKSCTGERLYHKGYKWSYVYD